MTKEEAIEAIKEAYGNSEYTDEIIKALEQEPCSDAISRQAVKMQMIKYGFHSHFMTVKEFVKDLPPVNPQPKTGHWIRVTDKTEHLVWECDKCGWQQRFNTNFCPDCGAKMIEPQESEDMGCYHTIDLRQSRNTFPG